MRLIFGVGAALAVLAACGPAKPVGPAADTVAKNSADLVAYLDA
jgi:hypothetical protein